MICENCGKTHDGKYGSGRFCSQKCARGFSSKHVSEEGRKKQREVLNSEENRKKIYNTRMIKSENYEMDSEGRWNKIYKSKKKKNRFNDNNDRYRQSTLLGKSGELITAKKFIDHGYNVYIPLIDDGADMVVEKNNGLKKIQVKSATNKEDGNSTAFKLSSSNLRFNSDTNDVTTHVKKYKKQDVDYFALYSKKDDDVYLIKNNEDKSTFTIRTKLDPDNLTTKGRNLERLHMAEDYQIDKVLDDIDNGVDYENIIEINNFVDNSDN